MFEDHLNISSPEIKELANALNFMAGKLKDLDRMKSDFFSSVSQELQTPLTSIQVGTNLLLDAKEHPLTDMQKGLSRSSPKRAAA